MRIRLLPSLALLALAVPVSVACGGTEEPSPSAGGSAGAGGASGGAGGATGGTAGTGGSTGGSAGTVASGGSAGTGTAGTGTAGTGTAGTGTAGTGGGGATDSPADTSQAGLEAFIAAASHKGVDWKSGTDAPNEASTSVHGSNRIWYNKTLRTSAAAGNGTPAMPHTAGSMVVKEIYTGANVVGHAVMLRTSANQWIYYCKASEGSRCTTSSMPDTASYATTVGSCSCHGAGTIVSGGMIPAP